MISLFFSLFVPEICNGGCWQSHESEFEKRTGLFSLQGHGIVDLIVPFPIYIWQGLCLAPLS